MGRRHVHVVLNNLSFKPQMCIKLERADLFDAKWQRLSEFAHLELFYFFNVSCMSTKLCCEHQLILKVLPKHTRMPFLLLFEKAHHVPFL